MILSKRERTIAIFTVVAVAGLALDRYALTRYLGRRAQLTVEKQGLVDELEQITKAEGVVHFSEGDAMDVQQMISSLRSALAAGS